MVVKEYILGMTNFQFHCFMIFRGGIKTAGIINRSFRRGIKLEPRKYGVSDFIIVEIL